MLPVHPSVELYRRARKNTLIGGLESGGLGSGDVHRNYWPGFPGFAGESRSRVRPHNYLKEDGSRTLRFVKYWR
jgi:hypothetical protein